MQYNDMGKMGWGIFFSEQTEKETLSVLKGKIFTLLVYLMQILVKF
jgi:hypothetical protein